MNRIFFYSLLLFSGTTLTVAAQNPVYIKGSCALFYQSMGNLERQQSTAISFYNFKHGETVASIGAQSCNWEAAYASVSDSLHFYLEDIDSFYCNSRNATLAWNYYGSLKGSPLNSTFSVVIGNEKETKLPENIFDKILIINSFHEFTYPAEMLADIAKKLKPGGTLYIDEALARYPGELHPQCKKRMYMHDELIQFFAANGFVFQNSAVMIWYKKKPAREIFSFNKK